MSLPPVLVQPDPTRWVCRSAGGDRCAASLCGDVARVVARLSLEHGDEVLVRCEGRYAFTVSVLACWSVGAVVRLPPDLAEATLLALEASAACVMRDTEGDGLDVRSSLTGAAGEQPVSCPATDQEIVRLSTSGSTGGHRTVPKTTGQLLGEALMLASTFEVGAATVMATVPPRHIYGLLFGVLVPLVSGGAFVDSTPFFGEAIGACIRDRGVRVMVTVPAHLRVLTSSPLPAFAQLERVFSSGAPLLAGTARALRDQHGLAATEVFGSTETGGIAWRHQLQDACWTPLPGISVWAGEASELLLRSPFLPPEAPAPWVADDRIAMEGTRFRHLGRRDDVVKIASRRVSVGEVQRHVLAAVGVLDAVVLPVQRGTRTVLEALVVAPGVGAVGLRAGLADRLDGVAMPRFTLVDALPRTEHGKLPRALVLAALGITEVPTSLTVPGLVWTAWSASEVACSARVRIEAEAPWFEGHFPGAPVLPGVALLSALVEPMVRAAWPDVGAVRSLPRVRFLKPIVPGDELELQLGRAEKTVRFVVLREGERCAAGVWIHGERA